jgi:hypothetical protein
MFAVAAGFLDMLYFELPFRAKVEFRLSECSWLAARLLLTPLREKKPMV